MKNRFLSYLCVITLSASLVAPAHAFDLSGWFNSWSQNSKNAFYVGTAAVVATGLGFLAHLFYFKNKKNQVKAELVVGQDADLMLFTETVSDEAPEAVRQLSPMEQFEAGQRIAHVSKVKKAKEDLVQLKKDVAGIKALLAETEEGLNLDAMRLVYALKGKQQNQAIVWAHDQEMTEEDIKKMIRTLEFCDYDQLFCAEKLLLKQWSQETRQDFLDKLKRREQALAKAARKKEAQPRKAAKKRNKITYPTKSKPVTRQTQIES